VITGDVGVNIASERGDKFYSASSFWASAKGIRGDRAWEQDFAGLRIPCYLGSCVRFHRSVREIIKPRLREDMAPVKNARTKERGEATKKDVLTGVEGP